MNKLTHEDRVKIEALYAAGLNASNIAQQVGKHRRSIG